jgi:putative transposase
LLLCEISGISKSAYYRYKKKPLKPVSTIEDKVVDIYNKSGKRAGYRTIRDILRHKYKLIVNHKKVQRIMRENQISSIVRKKRRLLRPVATVKDNILCRNFTSEVPGKRFVTDITYIPTMRTMTYLCTVIDLYNNEPVAWNISDSQDKNLSLDAIKKLSAKVNLEDSIIHSDQGVHYTSLAYVELLKDLKVNQSMSRKGNCWDNAKAESFFAHFKSETIHIMKNKIKDLNDIRQITEEYMDYYIHERPQRKLGGVPPSYYGRTVV